MTKNEYRLPKTRIEWADYVWNPVVGCLGSCPYCYARRMAPTLKKCREREEAYRDRFYNVDGHLPEHPFNPVIMHHRLENPLFPKRPARIFVNSMSDPQWWSLETIQRVIEIIDQHQEHRFIFLTKHPQVYHNFSIQHISIQHNVWFGITGTCRKDLLVRVSLWDKNFRNQFLALDPLLNYIPNYLIPGIKWVIIGAMTGPLAPQHPTKKEWVEKVVAECRCREIPIFLKPNLIQKGAWEGGLIQEYPEGLDYEYRGRA